MRISRKSMKSWATAVSMVVSTFALCIYGLSWYHNFLFSPNLVVAWHGANLAVRSAFTRPAPDSKFSVNLKSLNQNLKNMGVFTQSTLDPNSFSNNYQQVKIETLIAANKTAAQKSEVNRNQLKKAEKNLMSHQQSQPSLNGDYSNTVAQQSIAALGQSFESAANSEDDVPSAQTVNTLITQQQMTSQSSIGTIPQKVLNNVQKTTGISANEVNELLNR